jgi:hypothetical protein
MNTAVFSLIGSRMAIRRPAANVAKRPASALPEQPKKRKSGKSKKSGKSNWGAWRAKQEQKQLAEVEARVAAILAQDIEKELAATAHDDKQSAADEVQQPNSPRSTGTPLTYQEESPISLPRFSRRVATKPSSWL